MMPAVIVDPSKVHEFVDPESVYQWLSNNHNSEDEVWIKGDLNAILDHLETVCE